MIEKYFSKLFKSNSVMYYTQFKLTYIRKNKSNITIFTNETYIKQLPFFEEHCGKRKNCWVIF